MKKGLLWFLLAILSFSAFGAQAEERETVALTDFAQRTVQAPLHPQCVVALSASIAEAWLQAGGALRGAKPAYAHACAAAPRAPLHFDTAPQRRGKAPPARAVRFGSPAY